MPNILISYRREDSAAYAGRLADRLREHFGRDNVFVDIDTIRAGDDFVEVIERSLGSCTVVVALIGRNWLDIKDAAGQRRLDGGADYVRAEIAKALERHIRVIPVLVSDAAMPEAKDLPQDLVALARRQAIELSDSRFHQDVDRLIAALTDTPAGRTNEAQQRRVADAPTPTWLDQRWVLAVAAVVVVVVVVAYSLLPRGGGGWEADTVSSLRPDPSADDTPASGVSPDSPGSSGSGPTLESGDKGPVEEREPNDDILHPNDLAFGTTVRAQIRPLIDKDFFRIRTPSGGGRQVRVVLSNRSKLMPEVEIWDRNFNSVTSKYSVHGDVYLSFETEPDSDYFVECRFIVVNRNFADPGDSGDYELTVQLDER